ncbi:UNVERIFIED_ORG: DNA-binding MarR family transcriptional regulator [Rhizobium etli]|uniref:MarR family transcriptional regulator n=1 Tax=Rhizobium TaxID=379 RepID=UPI00098F3711|nr:MULTISPECIES: MarR family transcriptional regulator [Rhizobium]ARQ59399.1 helix-turn-helix domain-containing protein [Rhizobium sp. Kim5]RSB92608.1 MarR family transcriptional regulator [Rhizobium sophoriradicis]
MQDPLKLDVFICFAVYTASHALNRVYKPLLDTLGLTYIRRERSREDERVVVIRLSEAGIRLKEKAIGIPGCIAEASGRDAADLTRLRAEIVALREALNGSVV